MIDAFLHLPHFIYSFSLLVLSCIFMRSLDLFMLSKRRQLPFLKALIMIKGKPHIKQNNPTFKPSLLYFCLYYKSYVCFCTFFYCKEFRWLLLYLAFLSPVLLNFLFCWIVEFCWIFNKKTLSSYRGRSLSIFNASYGQNFKNNL